MPIMTIQRVCDRLKWKGCQPGRQSLPLFLRHMGDMPSVQSVCRPDSRYAVQSECIASMYILRLSKGTSSHNVPLLYSWTTSVYIIWLSKGGKGHSVSTYCQYVDTLPLKKVYGPSSQNVTPVSDICWYVLFGITPSVHNTLKKFLDSLDFYWVGEPDFTCHLIYLWS